MRLARFGFVAIRVGQVQFGQPLAEAEPDHFIHRESITNTALTTDYWPPTATVE
jgi:hypothetical protein